MKIDRVVDVERRQKREHIGLDRADQQLQRHEKQRQHLRYPVAAGVEVRTPSHPRGNWGRLLDVSLGGCYLQIATPLPLHMRCSLLLRVGDLEMEMNATVRTSHPSVGMGLQFTSPAGSEHGERLRQLISQLESGALGQISPAARKPDSAYLTERLGDLDSLRDGRQKIEQLVGAMLVALEADSVLKDLLLLEGRRIRKEGHMILMTRGFLQIVGTLDRILNEMRTQGELGPGLNPQAVRSALIGSVEGMLRDQVLAKRTGYPAAYSLEEVREIFRRALAAFLVPR